MCKITVYMPCYNYGRFIEQAITSILKQTMDDWELIVINDGSTDNTMQVIHQYQDHPKIRIIDQENKGLNVTNNIALRLSNGNYIMRLDADDYLDENALLVMSSTLDTKPEVGLVYPDYYHVNEQGDIIEQVRREKIDEEVQILDLPAHGACTMFRKKVLLQVGGYLEEFTCQDGYELWLRFISRYSPYNVNIPLFYYRQHDNSITRNERKILETRRKIKRRFVEKELNGARPTVVGIIPVTRKSPYPQVDPFTLINGQPLIWYTINEALQSKHLDKIVITSEDQEILDYAGTFKELVLLHRDEYWSRATIRMSVLIKHILERLESEHHYTPQAVCTLYINTPLRKSYHIDKAIDTMTIFNVDTVISVQEETAHCYFHRRLGLEPLSQAKRSMRIEREAIYKENSAIFLSSCDTIKKGKLIGRKVGHITMLPEESIKINTDFDLWMSEKILSEWHNSERKLSS